ncbi:two-component response regulator ARR14-like [Solanum tuberosum]|uniref:two-component response regulator ARR14-like n=1 Tax=Solanum tuberosum TaxID=4113 RepID=UPI00073A3124|nr:PREDICTED: two-component response regulator ARR14-like [Solanum tuberosum]
MDCEITGNVNVPSAYIGLRILLVDHDTTSLSNITTILEEHSFKVTAIEQATIALSILREQIDQFDLVMVDVNMPEMNYLEFIKSAQLIKDKPIILMSPEVTIEMVKEATTQGACLIFRKSSISSMKLKDVWKHVKNYNNKANEISQHYKANQVYVMDNTSCPKKVQDRKGKSIANCSETCQDQVVGSLIEKAEAKRSKRARSTNEEAQVKSSGTLEIEENHSLLSKITTERPQKKRRHLQWTLDLDKKLDEAVHELGEKAHPKDVMERMCVPDLTMEQLTCHLKNYQSQTQQASNVQPATTMNFNEERHSNVLDSGDLSANFNELFQGAVIHQPSEVPFVASPSSNDDSLNRWDEWFNELLELDDFELKLSNLKYCMCQIVEELKLQRRPKMADLFLAKRALEFRVDS